ncbi:unnamed protein product, partial [Staurois parvus]
GAGTCQIRVPAPTSAAIALAIGSRGCPPRSLLGHVTDARRLWGHPHSAALLAHAQWSLSCEAASCHSRVPTLTMPAPGREDGW